MGICTCIDLWHLDALVAHQPVILYNESMIKGTDYGLLFHLVKKAPEYSL